MKLLSPPTIKKHAGCRKGRGSQEGGRREGGRRRGREREGEREAKGKVEVT